MGPERKPEQRRATCAQDGAASSRGGVYRPRNPRASPLWRCPQRHSQELRAAGGFQRAVEERTIEHFIACGDPHQGFARIYCDACGHDYLPAFSCKTRNAVRVTAEDAEGRKKLGGYMLRAPMSLEKMTYHAATGNRRARFDSGRVFYPVTNH